MTLLCRIIAQSTLAPPSAVAVDVKELLGTSPGYMVLAAGIRMLVVVAAAAGEALHVAVNGMIAVGLGALVAAAVLVSGLGRLGRIEAAAEVGVGIEVAAAAAAAAAVENRVVAVVAAEVEAGIG